MYIYFHTPNTRAPRGRSSPVYRINGKFYNVITLDQEEDEDWEHQALFRIPFQLNYNWTTRPILAITEYGAFLISSPSEGEFKLGSSSSKRAYHSPIREIYLMNLPETEPEVTRKELPSPDSTTLEILQSLLKYQISISEYFGHLPVKETHRKISLATLAFYVDNEWVIRASRLFNFQDHDLYTKNNIILAVKLKGGETHVCILNIRDGEYNEPISMKIESL